MLVFWVISDYLNSNGTLVHYQLVIMYQYIPKKNKPFHISSLNFLFQVFTFMFGDPL